MNFYMDTEFLEGKQKKYVGLVSAKIFNSVLAFLLMALALIVVIHYECSLPSILFASVCFGIYLYLMLVLDDYTENTIQLISLAMVSEDNLTFYRVSKDFNVMDAWYRFQLDEKGIKTYWIRDNVLKSIFDHWLLIESQSVKDIPEFGVYNDFTLRNFKRLLKKYGYTEERIKKDLMGYLSHNYPVTTFERMEFRNKIVNKNPVFYGYFADYDWVVFCWLFGKMLDLPSNFPMYCRDLKQMLDDKVERKHNNISLEQKKVFYTTMKMFPEYPKPHPKLPEHHALADALFNKELHQFILKHI